jgi:adenosylcobinamide-phosphate synthase
MAKYAFQLPAPLILVAIAIDALAGDPRWLPHPVRLIGAMITRGEALLWSGRPRQDLRKGAILAAFVTVAAGAATYVLIAAAGWVNERAAALVAVFVAWTTLALRGLDSAAADVERELSANDLAGARREIGALVGRDPDSLDRIGIIRAAVESVAENCSDGVIAPMFYLFAGGPVAAVAYKAISTLDSMIGYMDERYQWFGRASARLDDVANLLPARLTALCLIGAAALLSRRGRHAFAACVTSASMHASSNAGYPEAAMAGALRIQLGGDAVYGGEIEHRATMGSAEREPVTSDIRSARKLMRLAAGLAFCLFAVGRYGGMRII